MVERINPIHPGEILKEDFLLPIDFLSNQSIVKG